MKTTHDGRTTFTEENISRFRQLTFSCRLVFSDVAEAYREMSRGLPPVNEQPGPDAMRWDARRGVFRGNHP